MTCLSHSLLSSKLNLFDHTKLIISHFGQVVTYIDKNREMRTDRIEKILEQNGREVYDRLCYLRDVLEQMITKKHKKGQENEHPKPSEA
jgi:hypothetical protein